MSQPLAPRAANRCRSGPPSSVRENGNTAASVRDGRHPRQLQAMGGVADVALSVVD
jgi:hypothetical protein